jgi:hypothetical protein
MGKIHWEVPAREVARPGSMWRVVWRVATLTAALLSGTLFTACPLYGPVAMYGPQPAYGITPPPHDSSVVLQDFSYTPASPIHGGDTLLLTAQLNKPTEAAYLDVNIGTPAHPVTGYPTLTIYLRDDGVAPDATALDGVWSAELPWAGMPAPLADLPVTAELHWQDGYPGQHLDGPALSVLPEEEGP